MPEFKRPQKYQVGIFTPDVKWGSKARFLDELVDLFNPEIKVYPLPTPSETNVPVFLPSIFLLSTDQSWRITISHERTDIIYFPQESAKDVLISLDEFWNITSNKLIEIKNRYELDVNRITGISEFLGSTAEDEVLAVDYIKNNYFSNRLRDVWLSNLRDAEFHINQRVTMSLANQDIEINQIFRLKAIHVIGEPEVGTNLILSLDINTAEDNSQRRFTADDIGKFFHFIPNKTKELIERIE